MKVSDEQIHCVLLALQPVVAMASVKQIAEQRGSRPAWATAASPARTKKLVPFIVGTDERKKR